MAVLVCLSLKDYRNKNLKNILKMNNKLAKLSYLYLRKEMRKRKSIKTVLRMIKMRKRLMKIRNRRYVHFVREIGLCLLLRQII